MNIRHALALSIFVLGLPMQAVAMSEAERLFNWKMNLASDGTYMAEIEMQRQIILQQAERDYLNELIALGEKQKVATIRDLEVSIKQQEEWMELQAKLLGNCNSLSKQMDETVKAVAAFRIANLGQALQVEELAQVFRQQADLGGIDMVSIEDLAIACAHVETSSTSRLPICRIIGLFYTKTYASLSAITPEMIRQQINTFAEKRAEQGALCRKIETQKVTFKTRRDATQARLDSLLGKK